MKNSKKLILLLCSTLLPTLALAENHGTTGRHEMTESEKRWVAEFVRENGYYVDAKTSRAYGGIGNYIDRETLEKIAHQKAMAAQWESEDMSSSQSSTGWAWENGVRLRFPTNSADVSARDRRHLHELGREMSTNRDIEVRLNGYADSTGPDSYNNVLSRQRAENVATILREAGAPSSQIVTRAYGEEDPIATNETNRGRAMNRRVDVRMEDALAE